MPLFLVRKASPDDAEAICRVHKASVRGLCATAYSPEKIEAWIGPRVADDYRRAMTSGGEVMRVAELGDRVVGFASIKDAMLLALYVDPEQGRGAGKLLLHAAEDEARVRRVAVLSLQATVNAVPFYAKHGYVRDGLGSAMRGGQALPVVEMHKSLVRM
jgi:putative acetyltransferase